MALLSDLVCNPIPRYKHSVGIEYEIEMRGVDYPELFNYLERNNDIKYEIDKYWRIKGEDSLRNGVEFVSIPLFVESDFQYKNKALFRAIRVLFEFMERFDYFTTSIRTGVHLHFNVSHFSLVEIFNVMSNYFLFEPALVEREGINRNGNCFCLRNKDTETIYDYLRSCFNDVESQSNGIHRLDSSSIKYSSLNLAPLKTLGTLEFRFMQTEKDMDHLVCWINILYDIVYNLHQVNPRTLISKIRNAENLTDYLCYAVNRKYLPFILSKIRDQDETLMNCREIFYTIWHRHQNLMSCIDSLDDTAAVKPKKISPMSSQISSMPTTNTTPNFEDFTITLSEGF